MNTPLTPHPDFPCAAVTAVEVEAVRTAGAGLQLRYRVIGDIPGLRLPEPAAPAFTDGLWRGTCLEAFVRADGEQAYRELNLSPSSQWAAYRFDRYREGMARDEQAAAPCIEVRRTPAVLELRAGVELGPGLRGAPWRLGLSAVIPAADGSVSYWALRHPPGKPDFHHPDCFALELPAPDRT